VPPAEARSALIGRAGELGQLAALLAESRLVTVMGVGGVGKTQLALAAARPLAHRSPGGVFRCELSVLTKDGEVEGAVAGAFGSDARMGVRLPELVRQQLADASGLLVLDNCEHVHAGAAAVIAALLAGVPALVILATSRERLRLPQEMAWTLGGLAEADAVQLLSERARAHDASFAVTAANHDAVVEICGRLEGVPLALELAAARLAVVPPAAMARMLDRALSLLSDEAMPARQRTLRATLDWSYDLLEVEQRDSLKTLSVFAGRFGLPAAASVLALGEIEALDRLAALRDRSLLVVEGDEVAAYRLLEPVRQYARARLHDDGDEATAVRAHAAVVLDQVEAIQPRLLGVPGQQTAAVREFRRLLPDLRPAFEWAVQNEPQWAARMGSASALAWDFAGNLVEGEMLLTAAAACDPSPRAETRILTWLAQIVNRRRPGSALEFAEKAVAAGRLCDDRHELGYALFMLGYALRLAARHGPADAAYDEAAGIADEFSDRLLRAWVDAIRTLPGAQYLSVEGDRDALVTARRAHEARVSVALELGDVHGASIAVGNLATICHGLGDDRAARRHLRLAVDLLAEHGNWAVATRLLNIAGAIAGASGRHRQALVLWGAFRRLTAVAGRSQDPEPPEVGAARGVLGPDASAQAIAAGEALSITAMFELVRVEASLELADGTLTPRELEVARLVAAGSTSKGIARRLKCKERTVDNHVQNALRKLGFHSRAQLGGWLAERGL
jgi:predicted ATPase/DNA-binding CsgD family transcriptional regulator